MYSSITEAIWKTPSWMRRTIRVAVIAVSRQVLIARRWKQFCDHIVHPSRIDSPRVRRRNLPWGQLFMLPWTRHRGGVLNAGKTISSENTSVEVHSKHPCTIEYSIPLRRSEFWLSDVRECHSLTTRRGFWLNDFAQEFSTIGFLYLSKGLEFRLSGDGDCDSFQEYYY